MRFLTGTKRNLLRRFMGVLLLCGINACTPFSAGRQVTQLNNVDQCAGQERHVGPAEKVAKSARAVDLVGGQKFDHTELVVDKPGRLPYFKGTDDERPVVKDGTNSPDDIVILDYEQVDLRQILEELADALGISVVIDSSISSKITLRTSPQHPLHKEDLWPLLRLLLSDTGVTFEKKGDIYHAKREFAAVPPIIRMDNGKGGKMMAPRVLQIFPLRHINVEVALPLLKPLLKKTDKIISLPNINLLGVASSPDYLNRVSQLIDLLDADPFRACGLHLYYLHNAKAKGAAEDLQKIIKLIDGPKSTYQVLGIERINALLITAPPERGFAELERWVEILDTDKKTDREQIFIYRVKHLSAKALANTITKVFKRDPAVAVAEASTTGGKAVGADSKPKLSKTVDSRGGGQTDVVPTVISATNQRTSANLSVKVVADEDTNSLIIKATADDYRQLMETIYLLDKPPLEVMVNIVIAQVTLTKGSEFGIDWSLLSKYGDGLLGTSFDVTKDSLGVATGQINRNIMDTGFEVTGRLNGSGLTLAGVGGGRLAAIMSLIANNSKLQVLARPSILVKNNQEAVIKVGSEEPILTTVSNSTITTGGTTGITNNVQYRDTGITLTVTPHINEDGVINLDVHQEVSNLGENRTIYDLPSFTNTEVKTSAIVKNKSAIILGGIIQGRDQKSKTGVIGLMDLPFIGKLFSTVKTTIVKNELVLIIVPEIVSLNSDNSAAMKKYLVSLRHVRDLLEKSDLGLLVK